MLKEQFEYKSKEEANSVQADENIADTNPCRLLVDGDKEDDDIEMDS